LPKVEVLTEYCKSCRFCIINCPKDVLAIGESANAMGYRFAVVANAEACTGCRLCAISCPEAAIEVYK
jgi:2-oxoglutarate ferredoxin oxidoreductase subunit delta